METKGYLHVYTGDGKGKTTAAFGLALRALCAGMRVYVGQFIKSMQYNEVRVVEHFPEGQIVIEQLGSGCYIFNEPTEEDSQMARDALAHVSEILSSGAYNLVILDEVTIALHYKMIEVEQLIKALQERHPSCEAVVTGRYAPEALIEVADLVTEMREVKHYYQKGVLSRNGIDR